MKRLRSRERNSVDSDGTEPDAPDAHDWRDHFDLLEVDHEDLDEVWDLAGADAAAWDMSGDVIRRALGLEHRQPTLPPVIEAPVDVRPPSLPQLGESGLNGEPTAEPTAEPMELTAPEGTDESLTWLESVPAATTTGELAAFITEGETAPRPVAADTPTWIVPIDELAEATGTTPSTDLAAPVVPDLEIDWDAVATVPRVTARRSARRWERRIRAENERRAGDASELSDAELASLREVLDDSAAPADRQSA